MMCSCRARWTDGVCGGGSGGGGEGSCELCRGSVGVIRVCVSLTSECVRDRSWRPGPGRPSSHLHIVGASRSRVAAEASIFSSYSTVAQNTCASRQCSSHFSLELALASHRWRPVQQLCQSFRTLEVLSWPATPSPRG
eukprot:scaffold8494_cov125-Isochrysis_galbana.AAC.5